MTVTDAPTAAGVRAGAVPGSAWAELVARLPRARRERRMGLVAAGVLLVVCGGLGSASLVAGAGSSVPVVVAAKSLPEGHVLTSGDLRVATVGGSGFAAVPGAALPSLLGDTVTTSVPAGAVLAAGMVSPSAAELAGNQVVAVAVKTGALPAGVVPGSRVAVLGVPAGQSAGVGTGSVLVASARVVDVRADDSGGTVSLSLVVPDPAVLPVASAAAVGSVVVSLLPGAGR